MSSLILYIDAINRICKTKGWKEPGEWANPEFQELSDEISSLTKIKISRNTVRNLVEKVVNRDEKYQPQKSTNDALAQYLGFKNWTQFSNQHRKSFPHHKKLIIAITGALFLLFISFILLYTKDNKKEIVHEYTFEISNPVGKIPHTIRCNFDVSKVNTENIYIDFGHVSPNGQYIFEKAYKSRNVLNRCFHFPGVYRVGLFADNDPVDSKQVHVLSDGWFIYAGNASIKRSKVPEPYTKLRGAVSEHINFDQILNKEITDAGELHIPTERIAKIPGISSNYKVNFCYYDTFAVSTHASVLTTRFKNVSAGNNAHCMEAALTLIGERNKIAFQFTQKGCENYAYYRVGHNYVSGGQNDLPYLIIDFDNYQTISVKSGTGKVDLIVNQQVVQTFEHDQDLGNLLGFVLSFKDSPHIDFVELSNTNGEIIFKDHFEPEGSK
jgi:hypothetical protein